MNTYVNDVATKKPVVKDFSFLWQDSFEFGFSVITAIKHIILHQAATCDDSEIERVVVAVTKSNEFKSWRVIRFDYNQYYRFVFLCKPHQSDWYVVGRSERFTGLIEEPKMEDITWFQ